MRDGWRGARGRRLRVTTPAAVAATLLVGALATAAAPASSQERPAAGQEEPPAQEVDSTRLRINGRLEALSRGPGLDSARTHLDSIQARQQRQNPSRGASGAAPRDSTAGALLALPGYTATGYAGTDARFEAARRTLHLRGDSASRSQVSRMGMSMSSDSAIVYDEASGRVRALGDARYEPDDGDPLESESLVMDIEAERGTAMNARTRYAQAGTEWIVRGDLPAVEPRLVWGSQTSFTSCNVEEPHYHFETDQIKIHQNNVLVARPVRLYFADVPVAWLPFIAQSLGSGRSSGLLTPRFSINDIVRTSRGYNRRISNVGFYWAMSDYTDASVAMDWFSGRYTAVTGTFRYDWMRQFLDGGVNFRHYWREEGTELAFDTRHQWEMSERTRLSLSARYASSTDFVRQNSFDPREVTQTISSEGGFNHRFDWGSLNVGGNRQQFLSDDRVEMTLPSASLSLSPITLFQAPRSRASFYNNMTWNGSVRMTRRLTDQADQPLDTTFTPANADRLSNQAQVSSSLTMGNLSVSQNLQYQGNTTRGLPDFLLSPTDGSAGSQASVIARQAAGLSAQEAQVQTSDLTEEQVDWSGSLGYQQQLIGSTTITPSLSFSGRSVRNDTLSAASGFVSSPARMSFGARLKTDVYGFYPGFGGFEAVRHKLSPSFSYDYSPEVTPTALQEQVFGSRQIQTQSVFSVGLNQTWEASVAEEEGEEADSAVAGEAAPADSLAAAPDSAAADTAAAPGAGAGPQQQGGLAAFDDEGLERVETTRKVTLLALNTSVVTYDFVQADSAGDFLGGFTSTTLSNSVRSDYLRGLSIQLQHDLFDQGDAGAGGVGGSGGSSRFGGRSFSPHLSSVNFSFSLNNRSGIFDLFGLFGDDGDDGGQQPPQGSQPQQAQEADPFSSQGTDEQSIVPTSGGPQGQGRGQGGVSGDVGEWNANISYSLQRPRAEEATGSQMLQLNLSFRPTEQWDVSWRTSYDGDAGRFNDHMVRLTRDLHRWQAHFDFRQTATGNWSFRFEVSLMDNEDLHFDYEQRSQLGEGGQRRR